MTITKTIRRKQPHLPDHQLSFFAWFLGLLQPSPVPFPEAYSERWRAVRALVFLRVPTVG